MKKNTFIKPERLTGKTTIDQLFRSGESFFCFPFRVVYRVFDDEEEDGIVQILVNAPKRLHKTAVARNLLKRRIREAYRLHKSTLYSKSPNKTIQLALLYSHKEVLGYTEIEEKVKLSLKILAQKISDQ